MLQAVWEPFQTLLGLGRDGGDVNALQTVLRTILIYSFTLGIIRLGSKRFLSQATAFDTVVGIMLGSVMSRAISGSSPFLLTLLAGATLVGLHWLMAALALRFDWFGTLVKGNAILLIEGGKLQPEGMRRARLSEHDLKQALRMQNNHADPSKIKTAYLERSGKISVIPSPQEPRTINIAVEDGVQIVRVELE